MGIIVITIHGDSKRKFVNELHKKTQNGVSLVIVRRPKSLSILSRIKKILSIANPIIILKEIHYAIFLRLNKKVRKSLEYFREHSNNPSKKEAYLPKVMEVDSINGDEVYNVMRKISPDLLVIWGSEIIKPRILGTAKKTINLHMGLCPYYRGNLCNQFAVLRNDFSRIGSTIHYAIDKVDSGNILAAITADVTKSPKELFIDLNDKTQAKYLEIAKRLYFGEKLPSEPQDVSLGKNFTLKQWTNETRYNLGKKILKWEKDGLGSIIAKSIPFFYLIFIS